MKTKQTLVTALAVALVFGSTAFAGPGGNGNSNGRGASDNGNNTNGAIASELKWRNAAHASAEAFLNASPNSAVGILATYQSTTNAVPDLYIAAGIVPGDPLRDMAVIEGEIAAIEAEISALDDSSETYLVDLEALNAELTQLVAELALSNAVAAKTDAEEAVGIADLSDEAIEALWNLLDK